MPVPAPGPDRRRRKRPRYWLRRLLFLLILLLPFAGWRAWQFWHAIPLKAEAPAPRVAAGKPVYVVLLGVDERKDDVGRSDTLMLIRLDPGSNSVHVVNIPRDTRITYGSGTQAKINSAYPIGGAGLVTEVVAETLQIPRPYYVQINFQSFVEIVNQLDGIDLMVDRHYVYDDPYQDLHIDIPAGQQRMYGETALHFVRLRYDGVTDSDLGRIARQQQFLRAVQDKLKAPSSWARIPDLIETMRRHVKTNLPEADQLDLARQLWGARENLKMTALPGMPDEESSDWLMDRGAWSEVKKAWPGK